MTKSLFIFLICCISFYLDAEIGGDFTYFYPKIYQKLWPDFCLEHLTQNPLECSEQYMDGQGNFYVEFLQTGTSEAYFDKEIIAQLLDYQDLIPKSFKKCNFRFCQNCHAAVLRKIKNINDYENEEDCSVVCYKCRCLKRWYNEDDWENNEQEDFVDENWKHCENQTIHSSYFNIHSKQYISFLEQHLKYVRENPTCSCYWPNFSKIACEISDTFYESFYALIEDTFLIHLVNSEFNVSFPYLVNSTEHGVITGLFLHSFFYSQYKQILLRIGQWEEMNDLNSIEVSTTLDSLYKILDVIRPQFVNLYSQCLKKHPHPKIYYERGLALFHQGKMLDSLSDIDTLIKWVDLSPHDYLQTSELYLQEGTIYAELGLYDKAIEGLSKAIQKDPNNKTAYFERASAYFELGNFDLTLEDYLASGIKPKSILSDSEEMISFSLSLTKGLLLGGTKAGIEFIPSLLSCLNGIGHGLWVFAQDPIQISMDFVQASQDCINFIRNHTPKENLTKLVPELQELIEKWDDLEHGQRGETTGHIIGKYGVEIFAGSTLAKGIKAYRELKKANNLLTFEAMAISERNKSLIKLEALKKAQIRKDLFQNANLKIQWDKQGKHVQGHKNFQLSRMRSILEHPDPQRLIDNFAGKGMKISGQPGIAGYREIIDFKEFIGFSVHPETGERIATSWGKIHYAKDGVHIVPTEPRL